MKRTIPKKITSLQPNEIFVFGSNLSGIHGAGAAKTAMSFGAIWKQGEGLQGQTYAIPTKDKEIQSLLAEDIQGYINTFIVFAKEHPELTFLVTDVGCGLAGFLPCHIAPMFKDAIELDNVHFSETFWKILKHIDSYRDITVQDLIDFLQRLDPKLPVYLEDDGFPPHNDDILSIEDRIRYLIDDGWINHTYPAIFINN